MPGVWNKLKRSSVWAKRCAMAAVSSKYPSSMIRKRREAFVQAILHIVSGDDQVNSDVLRVVVFAHEFPFVKVTL